MIASMLSHKVYKKGMKPAEMFPYLQEGVPDFLEDTRVAKARNIKKSISGREEDIKLQLEDLSIKLQEEIDIELAKEYPDHYVITQLRGML